MIDKSTFKEQAQQLHDELLQLQRRLAAAKGDYPHSRALKEVSDSLLLARRSLESVM